MIETAEIRTLDPEPRAIVKEIGGDQRVLLFGPPGVGKSTLATAIGAVLSEQKRVCNCLGGDPGSPAFGVPGAVCLGQWSATGWTYVDLEPLCSLDAARFRLPLVQAVGRLLERAQPGVVLVDGPGVVRGVGAAELLEGLVQAAAIDLVLVLERDGRPLPLTNELSSLGVPVCRLSAAGAAVAPTKRARSRARTALWDDYLRSARSRLFDIRTLRCTGTPPPRDVPSAWIGRQVALLHGQQCLGLGEVSRMNGGVIEIKQVGDSGDGDTLLVRDAQRAANGFLRTATPLTSSAGRFELDDAMLPKVSEATDGIRPAARVGPVKATLVNGIFGDPLLHLRFCHQRRSILFDLGECHQLPARLAHRVTEVFISHAHIDHISGFLWLLRARIGETSVCRIFGPPGLAANIGGLIGGIHWDRIGSGGPRFEVSELHGERLFRSVIQAGATDIRKLGEISAANGILTRDATFIVRAVTLDHRTPVLAFSFEPSLEIKVRKERLDARGLPPGPWLTTLKEQISAGQQDAAVKLPDGSSAAAGELAEQLLLIRRGQKLVYATDLADTAENRVRLQGLAQAAHVFFCEAAFCVTDAEQAARTGHLTARACGEIAMGAGVEHLVPFHFSRRYQKDPGRVYAEVSAACSGTVTPPNIAVAGGGADLPDRQMGPTG